jgi:D-alanine-D-alanine ligase
MHVAIVHNAVPPGAPPDERDVLVQVAHVSQALCELGHRASVLACTLNLAALKESLVALAPDAVFNLVESLDGSDRLIGLAPALYETLGLPFTGAGAAAFLLTSDKLLSKERLHGAGLPTPAWFSPGRAAGEFELAPPYIVKTVSEHGSFGMSDASVVSREDSSTSCEERIAAEERRLGRECFAEAYIAGREFNLSLLADAHGPCVLPPAEIDFSRLPNGALPIVGYDAKWREETPEFHGTPRTFLFPEEDRSLLAELESLALACWRLFGLRGYARVDFRVDDRKRPWILEINANPCLSPDAGFAAAAARAGLPFREVVRRILRDL